MNYPFICEYCGKPFTEDDWEIESCPDCGNHIVDAAECPNCGAPMQKGEMFCEDCKDDLATPKYAIMAANGCGDVQSVTINGFLAALFKPEEINNILAKAAKCIGKVRMAIACEAYMKEFDAEGYLESIGKAEEVVA